MCLIVLHSFGESSPLTGSENRVGDPLMDDISEQQSSCLDHQANHQDMETRSCDAPLLLAHYHFKLLETSTRRPKNPQIAMSASPLAPPKLWWLPSAKTSFRAKLTWKNPVTRSESKEFIVNNLIVQGFMSPYSQRQYELQGCVWPVYPVLITEKNANL